MWDWLRKIRGSLGNAALWAAVWSLATLPVLIVLMVLGFGDMFGVSGLLHIAPRIAASLAAMGFVAGGAFSTYLALAPSKHLEELDLRVVGILGGVFAGAMVPIFGFLPALISTLGVPFSSAVAGAVSMAGLLGAGTAVGLVKVAQRPALTPGEAARHQLEAEDDAAAEGRGLLAGPNSS